ncbi:MAG: WYL domain-containing protein [Oscillospiraceae bacterium]|nr:WYL domain-containing protein [Oscillospiraceae bacterium]
MPKSANQKLKLLYLNKFLWEKSDDEHPVTVADMIAELDRYGIRAERKSIYDDIEALRSFGVDIVQTRSKSTGYYIGQRDFELAELKLLVDSVQSSKFITGKKTLSLIKKIEGLTSAHNARLLQRQVYVRNRVKSMNESVYYNVDEISAAISADKVIKFRYTRDNITKEQSFRRNGQRYEISPYALIWDDENYYLLGYDSEVGIMKHFRVDKMRDIECGESFRDGKKEFEKLDMSEYSKRVFGMYTGQLRTVKLRFANKLVGPVIDRFGRDVMIVASDDEHFTVSVSVVVSPQFYAWLFGFGSDAEIVGPNDLRRELKNIADSVSALYA